MSSVSGLDYKRRIRARDLAMQAAFLALHHAPDVHYTQGPERWEGIAQNLKAWRGQYPHQADCSSFATWCLWNGLSHYRIGDVVNGLDWRAGYTGTMLKHGKEVRHESNIMRGDCVIYGSAWPGEHAAVCIGGGKVISHGSESAPFMLDLHYRNDILSVRRFI